MILCIFVLGAGVVARDCHRYGPVSPTFARADISPQSAPDDVLNLFQKFIPKMPSPLRFFKNIEKLAQARGLHFSEFSLVYFTYSLHI